MIRDVSFTSKRLVACSLLSIVVFLAAVVGPAYGSFRRAPEAMAFSLTGEKIDVNRLDKPVMMFFLSPQCLSCLPDLAGLKILNDSRLVEIIPICPGCDWRDIQTLNESFNLDLEIFMGRTDLRPEWGIWTYPTLFLVDGNNRIVDKWEDAIDYQEIEKQIEHLYNPPGGSSRRRASRPSSSSCSDTVCY